MKNYNIESLPKEEKIPNKLDNTSILKSLESNYLSNKKPFRATGLLNKSQLKLASFIKKHKDVTLQGTKRFMDKSGEYYLKNVQMQNRRHDFNNHKRGSLNNPQNLENCLNNGNALKIKKRASKILTLLPENALTPIPKKEGINKTGFANGYKKKELSDAQRTAVFIRRLEYATSMKKKLIKDNDEKEEEKKIIFLQQWWKTMHKVIKLQKNLRGFIFRKKLMNNLEHQEKLYQFITEFDNIYNYHIFRQFMDNLKKKRDYEKAKLMEKYEDFGEKIDNLEKMHLLKNLRKCVQKWKNINKKQKKLALENLVSKINNLLQIKFNNKKLDTIKKINLKTKQEAIFLDDKVKKFREKKAKEKFIKNLIQMHKLKKILDKMNNKINKNNIKKSFDKLIRYKNISNSLEKLNKILQDKIKKNTLNDLKNIYFIEKLNDLIEKHNNKIDKEATKEFFNKLKNIYNTKKLIQNLHQWKNISNDINNRKNILNKLIQYKKDELEKRQKPELIDFKFDDSLLKMPKIDEMAIFKKQLNNITIYNNNKKLKKYFDKWKEYIKNKEVKDKLVKYQKKKIAGNKLISILNILLQIKNENNLKEYFNKWKEFSKKIKQQNLEDFIDKLIRILLNAEKESNMLLKKDAFDVLIKNNNIMKGIEKLQKFFDAKPKKDAFNALKKNAGMSEGFRILDKLFNKKVNLYKKDLYEKLKKNFNLQKASEKLEKLITDKIRKEILKDFIKKSKQEKGLELLNKLINKKLLKKALDNLKLNNNFQKACEILVKIINNKLKRDTWKKLVAMDFINILENYKNKSEKNKKEKQSRILKAINNLKKLKNDEKQNLLSKYLYKWKDITIRRKIKDKLGEKYLLKKAWNHWKNTIEIRDILQGLKDYALKKKYFNELKGEVERKNILRKAGKNKLLGKIIKNKDKSNLDNLRKYFNKWKNISNIINEREQKIKNLLNILKVQENHLLKIYFDKWLSYIKNIKTEFPKLDDDVPKYRKKEKFKEKEIIIDDQDTNEFNPTYYYSKKNIFKQNNIEQSQGFNYIETPEQEAPKIKKNLMKVNKYINNDNDNESSSNEDTIHGIGETLIQREKVINEPRNYTSQSFFIDKNLQNNLINSKNYDINSYNKNILPMKMKGDFLSLIEQNPKILEQKNPRIQVTNATCDLDQIINNENTDDELAQEEIEDEIEKLNDNFIINKNKVLSKVIKNCDKDLYEAQKPFRVKKDKWYSVGIPLNNNEAKWEFLNNIKGERSKNNINKFELIQKEGEPIKEDISFNRGSAIKRRYDNTTKNRDSSFKLREINFMQYYRSPIKNKKNNEEEKEIIRYGRYRKIHKKQITQTSFTTSSVKKRNLKNKYNIDRSHGKIELDPKIKNIDDDNYNDDSDRNNNY